MGGNGVFRIGVGVDGSAPSHRALEWAVEEARLRGGEVHAVTAWAFPAVTVGMEGLIHDPDLFPQAARRLQDEALKRVDSKGAPSAARLTRGARPRSSSGRRRALICSLLAPGGWAGSPGCCSDLYRPSLFIIRQPRCSSSGPGLMQGNERSGRLPDTYDPGADSL